METTKKLTGMQTRRELLKKGAYAAPAILTLAAVPAFAGSGSGRPAKKKGKKKAKRKVKKKASKKKASKK